MKLRYGGNDESGNTKGLFIRVSGCYRERDGFGGDLGQLKQGYHLETILETLTLLYESLSRE